MTSDRVRTKESLRVLMLVPYPNIQGPLPKLVPLLVDQLRALGCYVETERWSRHSDHEALLEKVVGRAADLRRIYARLRRSRFDVMYITTAHTWPGLMRDIPLILATKRVCPHRVIEFHGSYSDRLSAPGHTLLKLASRVLVGACDATLVLSRREKDEWSAFYPGGRFELVANPFSPESAGTAVAPSSGDIRGTAASARSRSSNGVPTLLFVGRLMPEEGVLDLGVLMTDPRWAREGCSNAIMEYMACGLPVVCGDGGGNREVVEDGKTGFVIAPADPPALAQRIAYLRDHEVERRAMGAAGRERILETFSLERMVGSYVRIYEEALSD